MFLLLAITHLIYFSFHLRLMIDDGRFAGLCGVERVDRQLVRMGHRLLVRGCKGL